jgi:hypothetical protein
MAEIEINILESAVTAWFDDRQCKIEWTFTREKADKKSSKYYVV